ncbi:MAG: BREX-1 system adenine-specific DNA-methyltransferase PglX [Rhodospirillales bacterium]|nr:MAG: BREX-1 system adenine-specific DNA-methyltransferase PglX [Rhodospirillales bacterium]
MPFDDATRNRLRAFVGEARGVLSVEFTRQLQQDYGLDPETGEVTDLDRLGHLDDRRLEIARLLREILAHYQAAEMTAGKPGQRAVLERIVREQAFTVLNRLAALRMMEARGLLIESVGKGYQSKGFQLYQHVAGTALGETGDTYRCFLTSLFDTYAVDLGLLFHRYAPLGRLFPREPALLDLLGLLNAADIEPLWAEDETIGWIYQYFNSKEERKAMREASQAPRNSRELAVRNQFFTPRYVVEFLVDNTLGRLWFNWTGGQTALRDRCQYLLVTPDERPEPAPRLRDPRTFKLLDPACGSMHFGLYAFDLFQEIYREAWDWEQMHGPGALDRETGGGPDLKPLSETYADRDAFLRDVPRLIIERNIYGVEIDPRAAQIASLALWLRAQRAWHEAGVKAKDRPQVGQGHVVAAVAPPAEVDLRKRFMEELDPLDAELFEQTLFLLKGLPELGVLLQVEKELPALIRKVFGEHGPMFSKEDMAQWQKAEARLREALTAYARAARSTYQGRLFAEDALQGLRMIDHCREVFDVVVMNPPFGALSRGSKGTLELSYPNSSNDLLAVFVERGLNLLKKSGRIGAITSRTCFFLGSFKDWRKKVVLDKSGVEVIADLGQGVMDDAMVEAAAYVLARAERKQHATVIRAIANADRTLAMEECVRAYRSGGADERLFSPDRKAFDLLPQSPFVYWTSAEIIKKFSIDEFFEPTIGSVRQGLATGDDPRYVRAVWEVQPADTIFCYYPTDGSGFCSFDDPIVQDFFQRRDNGVPKWAFHVKAGASQPWHSPITLKINWCEHGNELRNFTNDQGKLRSRPQNISFYYRPGFSWTRRAVRFYPYVIPGNCIPSVSRYMAFPDHGKQVEALGVSASRMASAFMRFYGEKFEFPNFLVESLKMLPWPEMNREAIQYFENLITREVEARRRAYQNFEPFHEFVVPAKVRDLSAGGQSLAFDPSSLIGEDGERMVAEGYGFSPEEAIAVERDLREALAYQRRNQTTEEGDEGEDQEDANDFVLDTSPYATEEAHISYLLGCVFGRWDIRYATGEREPSSLRDPFAPLPVCPLGMLQNKKGLPAEPKELERDYPLDVAWSGVLSEDEGNPFDIVERVRNAAAVIWGDNSGTIEENACYVLGVRSLQEYLRKPSGFFADHLKRYTKSSRKAPIYWPLSTPSGSYTLWLYYPSLTSQTLYTAVNDFVEPKLSQVSRDAATLRDKGAARSRDDEKAFEALQTLELELIELRDTLLKIAPTYRPNHDDGVQITAAPLWPLFRHRPWQTLLKQTWAKLEQGDYDWAHLAMTYWPERVREKCRHDKSLAIAHNLEHLYEEPPAPEKKPRGRRRKG